MFFLYEHRAEGVHLTHNLPIYIHKTDNTLFCASSESFRQFFELSKMEVFMQGFCKNDGIIAPDDPFFAQLSGQLLEGCNDSRLRCKTGFYLFVVTCDGHLKIEM